MDLAPALIVASKDIEVFVDIRVALMAVISN
jgi:hypothetical protein